jgi:hypothetical protein
VTVRPELRLRTVVALAAEVRLSEKAAVDLVADPFASSRVRHLTSLCHDDLARTLHAAQKSSKPRLTCDDGGGPGWDRTSDLPRVRRTLSP